MAEIMNGCEHPVKLVVIDLDGTFLHDDKSIPQDNLSALKLLECHGIPYTISTGRSYVSALPFLKHFNNHVPIVLQNGALILHPGSKDKLQKIALDATIARFVFSRVAFYDLHCVISRGWLEDACLWLNKPYDGIYLPYLEKHGINFAINCDEEVFIEGEISELILLGSEEKMHQLIRETVAAFSDNFSIIKSFEWQGDTFMELMGPQVSKSHSLHTLCKHLHVPVESVLFIGDNYNDLDAMRTAGYPVAVANALEQVRDLACYISTSNNDGGVGHAIRHMLGQRFLEEDER
jgi:Cof subfamily protein (haloacid dehalogenase superfamily)